MSEEIVINVTPQETRVAVIEQGVTQEVHIERASSRGLVGNIVMGRVVRVLPGMQSAFVDIGGERAAFLHVADMRSHRYNGGQGNGGNDDDDEDDNSGGDDDDNDDRDDDDDEDDDNDSDEGDDA